MSTEQELFAEVRAVLHEDVADVTAGPDLLAVLRRGYARRKLTRRLALAVPVVAIAAAAVVAVNVRPDPTPPGPARLAPVNVAYVKQRTTEALDGLLGQVIHEQAFVTKGEKYSRRGEKALYERWLSADGTRFRFRVTIAGKPVVDLSRDTTADVFVDYRTQTYRASPGVEPSPPQYDDVLTPEEIKQGLTDGDITVLGQEQLDGKPVVKMHRDARKADVPMDLWVDATTYLPVRWLWRQENSTPFDVTWLPPTPENLAQLTTVVPPGFTEGK
jgi:hypothetical protein